MEKIKVSKMKVHEECEKDKEEETGYTIEM
jgi:hypothetical protein